MGTKLNPDGPKIKALRVLRGWTQEQLAEIAGISLRTVQRAEAASSAAFETVKAIAAAFETDFDQLLRQDVVKAADQETLPVVRAHVPDPDPPVAQIARGEPALTWRRIWPTQIIALAALAVGLAVGLTLRSHVNKQSHLRPVAYPSISRALPDTLMPFGNPRIQGKLMQILPDAKTVHNPAVNVTASNPEIANNPRDRILAPSAVPAVEPADTTKSSSLDLAAVSSTSDLLRPLQVMPTPLAIPDVPITQAGHSNDSSDSMQGMQSPGAVRQAVSVAAKKTGGFVSRAKASVKRAF